MTRVAVEGLEPGDKVILFQSPLTRGMGCDSDRELMGWPDNEPVGFQSPLTRGMGCDERAYFEE